MQCCDYSIGTTFAIFSVNMVKFVPSSYFYVCLVDLHVQLVKFVYLVHILCYLDHASLSRYFEHLRCSGVYSLFWSKTLVCMSVLVVHQTTVVILQVVLLLLFG